MKTTLRILSLVCVLVMVLTLVACGKKETADNGKSNSATEAVASSAQEKTALVDYEWVKFEMPEGYSDAKESDNYVTIVQNDNNKHIIKLLNQTLTSDKVVADLAVAKADDTHILAQSFEVNGREWYPVTFKFNNEDSVILFGAGADGYAAQLTVYQMTQDDPAVQTILKSIEFVSPAK